MHTETWFENLKVRDLGTDRIIILRMDLKEMWTGFMWLRTGTRGRFMQTRVMNLQFTAD
jgi:hypothetical protein